MVGQASIFHLTGVVLNFSFKNFVLTVFIYLADIDISSQISKIDSEIIKINARTFSELSDIQEYEATFPDVNINAGDEYRHAC